ncbi:MAG: T9SS type A sorting domain-containing protein [Algoriphagus sp.]|nr:T9SS type A sorting domain-containing protein [Algoriphagus sp.]
MNKILILLFLTLSFGSNAQDIFRFDQSLEIKIDGITVPNPFSGGINSSQIQTIDLTGDTIEEWVIWDINSRQVLVFGKSGENFTHLPELSYLFPEDISGFLTLVDFDRDGKKDLFTSTSLGIKAYRNTSIGEKITWLVAQNFLRLDGSSNIQANNLDTPLIQDLDGDSDLDLVIFNFASGDFLEFYKNTSIERRGIPDVDGFAFPSPFWGNFVFCGCEDFSFGITCEGITIKPGLRINENARIQHAGGHSILYRDFNGDGISDLVLGRDECSVLYYLPNTGTEKNPLFIESFKEIPEYGALPEFPLFHVAQLIDDKLVVSLNTNETSIEYGIDFAKSIKRISPGGVIEPNFLQNQLFDLGENTRPFFTGNKFAGELWLTVNVKANEKVTGQAFRLPFSGSEFQLTDRDWLEFSKLNLLDLQLLEYTDIDKKSYFIASGIRYENSIPKQVLMKAEANGFVDFSFSGLTLQRADHLEFFTFENKDYLLVAGQNGSLDLYSVNFEVFSVSLEKENFLGFQDNPANRNLAITLVNKAKPDLYAIDQRGKLMWIENFMESDLRKDVFIQTEERDFLTRFGRNTWLESVNPNFDEPADLILGTRGGGVIYLRSVFEENPAEGEIQVKIYPNPSSGPIKVVSSHASTLRLINAMGQVMKENIEIPANREIEIQADFLAPGLYILQFAIDGKPSISRKVWML